MADTSIPEKALYAQLHHGSTTTSNTTSNSNSNSSAFSVRSLLQSPSSTSTKTTSQSASTLLKTSANIDERLKGKSAFLDNRARDIADQERIKELRRQKKDGTFGKRRRKKALTRQEKKLIGDVGADSLKDAGLSYNMFIPLYKMWTQYMKELFAEDWNVVYSSEQSLIKILRADYHGAVFTVTHSKCKHHVGISGIMIKETDGMFYIITRDNVVKGIPKNKSNFAFTYDNQLFTLYGSHLKGSASDRVTKKLRWKNTIEIS
ncbi:hypothetical protein BCR33DRAFT_720539 [Rhizoclosmatium globosum]|uniref:Ribonuclease P protein subunit n=1 Tax=Rhizoclosmatium globosum TaxID=329046 RepID=A0A1Y2BVV3_9FUNG|nr:hypothetical protein BCR33DRAFT_720539 [Rhizoclosmatium globosum]|eukprot:ORY38889.1 hypothetical protein BCR33DRAFT_720539 [Rhizoclosmatium globosum]